jgi:hypothetical protein
MSHIVIWRKGLHDLQCPSLDSVLCGRLPDDNDLPSFTEAVLGPQVASSKGKKRALATEDSKDEIEIVYFGPLKKKRATGSKRSDAIVVED